MSNVTEAVIECRDLHKAYDDGTRVLQVLRGTDLDVRTGEIISIVGSSGAGKSTLLHLLGALDRPNQGSIKLKGLDLGNLNSPQLAEIRARSVGFIFQFHHLLAEFTALENVIIPGLMLKGAPAELREKAAERLAALGLGDRLEHRPGKLSGGEQQRVALARALINEPDVVLADEPTGNLDTETAEVVIDLLWRNVRENAKSLVIVTHEPEIARRADRCLRLKDGKLIPQ